MRILNNIMWSDCGRDLRRLLTLGLVEKTLDYRIPWTNMWISNSFCWVVSLLVQPSQSNQWTSALAVQQIVLWWRLDLLTKLKAPKSLGEGGYIMILVRSRISGTQTKYSGTCRDLSELPWCWIVMLSNIEDFICTFGLRKFEAAKNNNSFWHWCCLQQLKWCSIQFSIILRRFTCIAQQYIGVIHLRIQWL